MKIKTLRTLLKNIVILSMSLSLTACLFGGGGGGGGGGGNPLPPVELCEDENAVNSGEAGPCVCSDHYELNENSECVAKLEVQYYLSPTSASSIEACQGQVAQVRYRGMDSCTLGGEIVDPYLCSEFPNYVQTGIIFDSPEGETISIDWGVHATNIIKKCHEGETVPYETTYECRFPSASTKVSPDTNRCVSLSFTGEYPTEVLNPDLPACLGVQQYGTSFLVNLIPNTCRDQFGELYDDSRCVSTKWINKNLSPAGTASKSIPNGSETMFCEVGQSLAESTQLESRTCNNLYADNGSACIDQCDVLDPIPDGTSCASGITHVAEWDNHRYMVQSANISGKSWSGTGGSLDPIDGSDKYYLTDEFNTLPPKFGKSWADTLVNSGELANDSAAHYCDNLELGGYTDWYLPTFGELAFLYCRSDLPVVPGPYGYRPKGCEYFGKTEDVKSAEVGMVGSWRLWSATEMSMHYTYRALTLDWAQSYQHQLDKNWNDSSVKCFRRDEVP